MPFKRKDKMPKIKENLLTRNLKNYLISFKYLFIPFAALMLGVLVGLSFLLPGVFRTFKNLFDSLDVLLHAESSNWAVAQGRIIAAIEGVDWDNPLKAIKNIFNQDWLKGALKLIVTETYESTMAKSVEIDKLIVNCVDHINGYKNTFVVSVFAGFALGQIVTKMSLRKKIAKRNLLQKIIHSLFDLVLDVTVVTAVLAAITAWEGNLYVSTILSMIITAMVKLLKAYLTYGVRKVSITRVFSIKNIMFLVLTELIIFAVDAVIVYLVFCLTNWLVSLFIGVVLFELAFIVRGLDAESYVINLVDEIKRQTRPVEPPATGEGESQGESEGEGETETPDEDDGESGKQYPEKEDPSDTPNGNPIEQNSEKSAPEQPSVDNEGSEPKPQDV